jgi:hypothetical protein
MSLFLNRLSIDELQKYFQVLQDSFGFGVSNDREI